MTSVPGAVPSQQARDLHLPVKAADPSTYTLQEIVACVPFFRLCLAYEIDLINPLTVLPRQTQTHRGRKNA